MSQSPARTTAAMMAEKPKKGFFRDMLDSIGFALLIFLVIRTFAFQAFRIPSSSMELTLLPGDFLFVNKFFYGAMIPFTETRLPGFSEPKPGDIIVFQYPKDPSTDYIKRCVAVGGDIVEIKNKVVYVNGVPSPHDFVIHRDPHILRGLRDNGTERDNLDPVKIPAGHLFMMGDNRDHSSDSRFWGTVDEKLIRGKAWVTYFSWDGDKNRPRFGRMFRMIR